MRLEILGPPNTLLYENFFYIIVISLLQHLGNSSSIIKDLASGNHPFSKRLAQARKPLILLGAQQFEREDGATILALVQQLADKTAKQCKVIT